MMHEEQLRAFIKTAVDGFLVIDGKGRIQLYNPASERIFGWEAEEVAGKNVSMLMPVRFSENHNQYIRNYIETGEAQIIGKGRVVAGKRKDGSEFPMHLSVGAFEEDDRRYFVGIVRDLTEETAEKERLRTLIETAVDAIINIDEFGNVELYNSAAERLFGWEREDIIGENVSKLMPDAIAAEHDSYIINYIRTRDAKIIGRGRDVTGKRKDGSEFPMHLSVGAYEADGQKYFVGIVRDLTKAAEEEARLRDLQSQLSTIAQHNAVSEMGAALAHELNQPLTAIDLFIVASERVLESDPGKARELFERVRDEVKRAGDTIRRIRQMVEKSDGERGFFAIHDVVESAVDLCRVVDTGDKTSIRLGQIPDGDVFGDETQIRQILVNLVKNALDATVEQESRDVVVTARGGDQKGNMVEIDVIDNGPGVPEDFVASLFEAFQSTKEDGLGIGLSICQSIAENHGGKITYLPRTDGKQGSIFRLILPNVTTQEERDG